MFLNETDTFLFPGAGAPDRGRHSPMSRPPPPSAAEPRPSDSTSEVARPVGVVLVDAQHLVRDGLAVLLGLEFDLEVLATAATVDAAAARIAESSPDVVVLDPDLGDEDGLGLVEQLTGTERPPRLMVLTAVDSPDALQHALARGATSYVLKQGRYGEIVAAIRQTAAGEAVISPQSLRRLVTQPSPSESGGPTQLTAREQQVLEQISAGATNTRIAQQAGISVRTAQKHVENLCHKLGVHGRAALVAEAFRRGLLR